LLSSTCSSSSTCCFVVIPPPPRSTLFPYTTLFRSSGLIDSTQCNDPDFRKLLSDACAKFNSVSVREIDVQQNDVRIGILFQKFKDRKSTRLNSSHVKISYAVFCLKKKKKKQNK